MRLDDLVRRAESLASAGGRRVLGIVGPPGAGKSTLATILVERLGDRARYVPMDGFHLANVELVRLGRRQRKGAPDTFDGAGYVALLRRLRDPAEETVYAPTFRRDLEEPIAGAIPVPREVPLVVTEGNYLLLDTPPWSEIRHLLDDAWYLDPPEPERLDRLIRRHQRYGKSPEEARAWALGSDQANAELVATSRGRADLVLHGFDAVDAVTH
ncbi:nucleoside/nucleotide kinase family protein [Thermasporomyces composti]|jgi:pantothenate kinase|uniref:Pantothenate kinase n=1 Tax=Thermasporomyces composti TaxID=696763 RepID=A0A3D9V2C0_THECX|nr:nucleoside/nucleotide kinase family protein [Thermasporomyces composti]REF35667.1 hypothetical protein DFJ64_1052 [Thermasporomyces composti]